MAPDDYLGSQCAGTVANSSSVVCLLLSFLRHLSWDEEYVQVIHHLVQYHLRAFGHQVTFQG